MKTTQPMNFTHHAIERMNQRGITKAMIVLAMEYGNRSNDKLILGMKKIKKLLNKVEKSTRKHLMKLLDKGGLTVVFCEDVVVTVYNCNKKGLIL
jgi:hypothetical protein